MSYLTGPVNTLIDGQVEFNGLLMGPNTQYIIEQGQTFLDMPAIKTMDQARDWADGSWSGPDFADVLLPTMPVTIHGAGVSGPSTAVFLTAVQAFQSIFGPQANSLPLWVKVPGLQAQGIPAKVNQRSLPLLAGSMSGAIQASVQFRCPDPIWQTVPRNLTLAANGSALSGLVFPVFAPASGTYTPPNAGADFGSTAVAASSGTLTNAGNSPAWPVVVVSGPVTNFTVTIDGNQVTWTDTIPAGQTLTIDYSTGLATQTGNVDRTYSLTSRAFSAVPGGDSSAVFFTASTGSAIVTIADVSR